MNGILTCGEMVNGVNGELEKVFENSNTIITGATQIKDMLNNQQ